MSDSAPLPRQLAYLPPDRAEAVLGGALLPERDHGAVLFSDISGFTPLTEAVIARYGPRQGGEEFTDRLNAVYDALIDEVERFGGSIVGFAGDAMVVWFAGDDGAVAVTAALSMQRAMGRFAQVSLPGGQTVSLAMKVAVATGPVKRFQVGDGSIQFLDVMAGDVMERVSDCEGVARRGEVAVDAATAQRLGGRLTIKEWRPFDPGEPGKDVAVIESLQDEAAARPRARPVLPPDAAERLRPWLLPEVGRRLGSGQDVFLTELRPATALFARFGGIDFEGDPEAPAKLDAYVRWVQRVVARLEGVLVQLTIGEKGSYFYAAWGAPIAHDDDTRRACTAALEILHPPPDLAAFIVGTRIGITSGTMRTGAYGNRVRCTYGILGDDTNLAARLMAKAGRDEILVSAQAARRQEEAFEFLPLPSLTVKGKKEPVPVFRLVGRRQRGLLGAKPASPMVGRSAERALAVGRLREAARGRGQVIGVTADAGMGKTRLLREIVGEAEGMGFAGFAGDCPALASEASYSVWIPIWRAYFGVEPGADAPSTLAAVHRRLEAIDPALVERAPLLGPLLGVDLPDSELTRTLDPKVRRSSMQGLVVECIRHRARAGPLLLVVEEAHWIDEASRSLLGAVVQALARLPVALVVVYRPVRPGDVFSANDATLDYLTIIELGDLPEADARLLAERRLGEALGTREAPAPLVDLVTARASGNPFFIEEVANLLKARRSRLVNFESPEELELPESLHSLVLGRIDQLTEDAQATLKVASVIGRLFRTALLFGVHPLERVKPNLAAQLAEMQRRDIAVPEPGAEEAYLFKHVVIQEVAYESLPSGFRAQIHGTIGEHLERLARDNVKPFVDLLAFHYGRSTRDDKKRTYFVAAADAAKAAHALPTAIGYYERALALLEGAARVEALARLGEVLELAGRWDDAFTRYREARDAADKAEMTTQGAAMAGAIGDLHRKRGEFAEAETWIKRARQENAGLGNEAGVALMLHLEATLCAQTGKFERAEELYQRALAIRERIGDEAGTARSLNNLGIVARSQGRADVALVYYERSLAIRRRINDRREIANSLNNLGFIRRLRGEFDRARELLEESVQLNRSVGDRWSTANALSSLAELALDTGDAELARRCLRESIAVNRELGDRRALAFLLEGVGKLGRLRREPGSALLFFAAARGLREAIGAPLEPADARTLGAAVDAVREELGGEASERVEAEGRGLPLGEALDRALTAFP